MKVATRELLAPRADVWAFLAEPYNLADWWPGITGVVPDRRGFAVGARWKVISTSHNWLAGNRPRESLVLVRTVDPYERFAWHLLKPKTDVDVTLAAAGPDRTLVTVSASRGSAIKAVGKLYDLVQTAASFS